jgi:hypothetical protein
MDHLSDNMQAVTLVMQLCLFCVLEVTQQCLNIMIYVLDLEPGSCRPDENIFMQWKIFLCNGQPFKIIYLRILGGYPSVN